MKRKGHQSTPERNVFKSKAWNACSILQGWVSMGAQEKGANAFVWDKMNERKKNGKKWCDKGSRGQIPENLPI